MRARRRRRVAGAALVSVASLSANLAYADEPRLPIEPRVMHEPGDEVQVIDAFEDGSPPEVNVSLGFVENVRWATIDERDANGKTRATLTDAETRSLLLPRLDVGLYHDLAFYAAMPITLSRVSSLGSSASKTVQDGSGSDLFAVPFRTPDRSGPDYLALGAEADAVNQTRKASFPTWLIGAEVRIPIGESLHACDEKAPTGQVACAAPADTNRNGKTDPGEPAGIHALSPGAGRGTVGLELHSYVARRVHYAEPYAGARGVFEFPVGTSDFARVAQAGGGRPPIVLEATAGTMFIPWENRERFSRVTLDARVAVAAHTEGPDATELYDALGSTIAASVRTPSSGTTPFTGLTRAAAFASGRVSGEAIWQSGPYVKLSFLVAGGYESDHALALPDPAIASVPDFESRVRFSLDLGGRGVFMF